MRVGNWKTKAGDTVTLQNENYESCAKVLLENGADKNLVDHVCLRFEESAAPDVFLCLQNGRTPLTLASFAGRTMPKSLKL